MSSYINSRAVIASPWGGLNSYVQHNWTEHTRLDLLQHYHPDQVSRIMAVADHRTQVDIARWNALGRRSAA